MSEDGRERFQQDVTLWRWSGASGGTWFFVRFTGPVAEAISALALMRRLETGRRRGWGSLKVEARIGKTSWPTSIFPGDEGAWLLPVKRAVRASEALDEERSFVAEITL